VADLNEVVTTYTATNADGRRALAVYILSARGYYTALFFDPPEVDPTATATPTPTPAVGGPVQY
jgi:hypothetical protein